MRTPTGHIVVPLLSLCTALLCLLSLSSGAAAASPVHLALPKYRLQADELAVIVNDADPLSVKIGAYYVQARGLPPQNLFRVRFNPGGHNMPVKRFTRLRAAIERATPAHIQAYAITWAKPWRVDCMSFTSALAFGFDRSWCSRQRCAATRHSPYYGYTGASPHDDLGVRPAISIAATDFDEARALIDRGIAADGSLPEGTAYLVSTSDKARNVRAPLYPVTENAMRSRIATQIVETDALRDRDDVLFYFTGVTRVAHLDTLTFLPGAIADHLTSAGGRLTGSRQMSALRWLQAGATGSYGTVVEPCNLLGKFPRPAVVTTAYTSGRTLIEAYWQSVQQPGEGIFIGEPLAAPFDSVRVEADEQQLRLYTRTLVPGRYVLLYADSLTGPWRRLDLVEASLQRDEYVLPRAGDGYYRLEALPAGSQPDTP
jgi:uncharacterized protein (TIGR03790 family)